MAGRVWHALPWHDPWLRRCDAIESINRNPADVVVIVPHGSSFPEALLLKKPVLIYRPGDIEADAPAGGIRDKLLATIDRLLAEKAVAVATSDTLLDCPEIAGRQKATSSHQVRSSRLDQPRDSSTVRANAATLVVD